MASTIELDDVVEFVREFTRVPPRISITADTRIEADLGVTGDDGVELLLGAEERFCADFGDDLAGVFGLDQGQTLFNDEGTGMPGMGVLLRLLGRGAPPEVRDLKVGELYEALLRSTVEGPNPPFLVLRPSLAFWVERERHSLLRATPQAFREGCYEGAEFIDRGGGSWPVVGARLRDARSLWSWLSPAKPVRVKVTLGSRRQMSLAETISSLIGVLRSDSEWCAHLSLPPQELASRLERCESYSDVIEVAAIGAT
ncbi:MAG: DUF1493 family protein [Gemmatimonadota bacterium]|nr:DUF1493 family protein [Gemmatimonadota bacterium]